MILAWASPFNKYSEVLKVMTLNTHRPILQKPELVTVHPPPPPPLLTNTSILSFDMSKSWHETLSVAK